MLTRFSVHIISPGILCDCVNLLYSYPLRVYFSSLDFFILQFYVFMQPENPDVELSKPFLMSSFYIFRDAPTQTVKKRKPHLCVDFFLFISFWQMYLPGDTGKGMWSLTASFRGLTSWSFVLWLWACGETDCSHKSLISFKGGFPPTFQHFPIWPPYYGPI